MSFGGFGFGQNNNNQQQNTGFGGFGQNNQQQQSTGFGSSGGFGSTNTNTGGGLFGNTSGGFGSGGGFGSNTSSAFGAPKPAFGAATTSSGGGLFGSSNTNTATSGGFGGFGGNTTNTNTNTSTFGSSTGGGLFGQSKPAFGSTTTNTGGSLFGGGGGNTGSTFGATTANNTSTGFGSTTSGFGSTAQAPQNNGTGAAQFEAHREKEGTQTSVFQSITMQQPYQQFSFEELRLADYQQGRKYGNSNGQAGAFGQSTGFGGFGSTTTNTQTGGGGLFGNNQQQSTTTGGFGTTGGGLFGSKPATGGGLFGSTPATSAPAGGLFGAGAGTTAGGFGGSGASTGFGSGTTAGGGLFGSTQNKPAFGGFGGTSATPAFGQSSGTTGFGTTATSSAGGGLFGSGGASSFGQQNTGASTGFGGGFGNNNNQQQQQQPQAGGGLFGGGGGFGANNQQQQQKPGGLFGSTQPATGGGLFGSQPQQQQQTGGLFGASTNNQQQGGGLFGSKPASTGANLFGNAPTANTGGGGLFGNLGQQNQPNAGGSLFGSTNTQQQQKPSLFGNLGQSTTNNSTGGGLFGNLGQSTNSQPQGGSLFGSTQQPQQQQGGLFGSMNQSQQAQPQQAPQLTASLLGTNPYGNDQLFASLGTSTPSPGPIATPLSGQPKTRKPAILPQHKVNPLAASRLITPQKRQSGFGFSYSTYGTPGSAMGTPTGFSSSLLSGGSLGRSLSKSFSASNLRNVYNAESSNLAPGLFAPGRSPYASGSMKRLSINRNLDTRRSLFPDDEDVTPRKRVLFEESTPNGNSATNGNLNGNSGALVRTEEDSPTSTAVESPETNGHTNGAGAQTNGALNTVPEEAQAVQPPAVSRADAAKEHARRMQIDQNPGDYWSKPTVRELQSMSRSELKRVHLTVGRDGIGMINFGEVDLSDTPLDRLLGTVIYLEMRHATVYGDSSGMQKPPQGKALNVPSEITLENSWPRKGAGRAPVYEKQGAQLDKHITRLKRVGGAEFVNYDANTGAWTFKVQHYTTYGLDYDDEDESMMSGVTSEEPSKDTAAKQNMFAAAAETQQDDTMEDGSFESSPDDTFNFRQGKPRKHVPGNFDDEEEVEYEDEEEMEEISDSNENTQQSFLGDGSVGPLVLHEDDDDIDGYAPEDREEMAGTFPVQSTEPDPVEDSPIRPKSILRHSQLNRSTLDTPGKNRLVFEANWTEQLQRTASPRKQTRQALRESQATVLKATEEEVVVPKPDGRKQGFSTSIDIMNSLFGRKENTTSFGKKQSADGKGFEWPYAKRSKTGDAFNEMDDNDKAFHLSMKPRWGPDGRLVYATSADAPQLVDGTFLNVDDSIIGEHTDIRFAKFAIPSDLLPATMDLQQSDTTIHPRDGDAPHATNNGDLSFADIAAAVDASGPTGQYEKAVWTLASVLFDDLPREAIFGNVSGEQRAEYQMRARKDNLSSFWKDLVKSDAESNVFTAGSSEEKAVHHLSAGDVAAACRELMTAGDFKLATMIAQAGGSDQKTRDQVRKQIQHWDSIDSLSEFSIPIRALYEILAGNTAEVAGKDGHRENAIKGFNISEQFSFDWKRAFGLRLWYGSLPDDSVEDAVQAYRFAQDDNEEKIAPSPAVVWVSDVGDGGHDREDLLWGLLQLYAAQHSPDVHVRIESILDPGNMSGNPNDARLCWQLLQMFQAKGIRSSAAEDDDADSEKENRGVATRSTSHQAASNLDLASDALTSAYASALTSALPSATPEQQPHLLYTALFVLTHLSNDKVRQSAIDDLLHQTAPLLSSDDELDLTLPSQQHPSDPNTAPTTSQHQRTTLSHALTSPSGLSLPRRWLATAQALWARTVQHNPASQCRHLLDAGQVNDAHAVLLRQIGPSCVVRRDTDLLREVLGGFEGHEQYVSGWRTGGAVYFDYVHLLDMESMRGEEGRRRGGKDETVKRLVDALVVMGKEMGRDAGVDERAAVWEMGRVVAAKAGAEKTIDKSKVLQLPLTQESSLMHTRELSLGYYRALMAGGH